MALLLIQIVKLIEETVAMTTLLTQVIHRTVTEVRRLAVWRLIIVLRMEARVVVKKKSECNSTSNEPVMKVVQIMVKHLDP
jgi:hypothetical protein